MITIRCTQKLFNEIGIKKVDLADSPGAGSDWYAHLFYYMRKKHVMFTHAGTLFTLVAADVKRQDIKLLDNLLRNRLEAVLKIEGIADDSISKIISECKSVQYAKTVNRAVIGSMNDLIFQYECRFEYADGDIDLIELAKDINRVPMSYINGYAIDRYLEINGIPNYRKQQQNVHDNAEPQPSSSLPELKYYVFNIWIHKSCAYDIPEPVSRKIQIAEVKSLYNLAKVITQAFGFYFDHPFGFYDNFERYHDSQEAYELFTDMGEDPRPGVKKVKTTQLQSVFKKPGDKMMFLFDYGDGWYFGVELMEILQAKSWDLKPRVLESTGTAPEQYPPCE
jgi:hypothetical protein